MPVWMRGAIGYEVYVRSFMDTDGDGLGDLRGVRQRLDHLVDLGVDVVWLTPVSPSPDADHGYDVADYMAIDPRFGDLDEFTRLVQDAHDRGLRLIMDLVPNHTSIQHPWFRDALSGPGSTHRDWYVWHEPGPDGAPPNNWVQHLGGPAWTLDEASRAYYLHLFLPEQPDLNWHNPAVRQEFCRILQFWLDRDVDGFRVDVAHALTIDPQLRDNPLIGEPPTPDLTPREAFARYAHLHDLDQGDNLEVFRAWRDVAQPHDAVLIGEVYLPDAHRWGRYVDGTGLHAAFWFPALQTGWDAGAMRRALTEGVSHGGAATCWPLSSHDDPYATTRFGGGELGRQRGLAWLVLLCVLPGAVFLHQGEELGLDNAEFAAGELVDPMAVRNQAGAGRDGTRAPMPWEPGHQYRFTSGTPWLPHGHNRTDRDTVAVQRKDPASHLHQVRQILHRRRAWRDLPDEVTWLDAGPDVIALRRGSVIAAMNLGDQAVKLPAGLGGLASTQQVERCRTLVVEVDG